MQDGGGECNQHSSEDCCSAAGWCERCETCSDCLPATNWKARGKANINFEL